ncbi:MAG TPA: diguanylate cyclase, partial [Solirubrobacteraceae bacterium]
MRRPLALAFAVLVGATVVYAVQSLTNLGGAAVNDAFYNWVYTGIELGAILLLALRVTRRGPSRLAWACITIALATWAAGDLLWTVWLDYVSSPPFPSVADAVYFASYPFMYAGILLLIRTRLRHFRRSLWLDGSIAALAAAAIAVALVVDPVRAATHGSAAVVYTTLAYPVLDVVLFASVIVAWALTGWRPDRALLLLGLSLLTTGLADAIYSYQESVGTYSAGTILNVMWPASFVLAAAAAWQRPPANRADDHGWRSAAAPSLFVGVSLGMLVYDQFHDAGRLASLLAIGALAVAILRAGLMWRENVRLLQHSHDEARRDGLSGLRNRRALMADLEEAARAATPNRPYRLVFFDLDGFKSYNDAFGHAAGDGLLRRLAAHLDAVTCDHGTAYRLGGDEFCLLLCDRDDSVIRLGVHALSESGPEFSVSPSYGVVELPTDTIDPSRALRLADSRMYAHKRGGRLSTRAQTRDVLMQVLSEREPELTVHVDGVASLAVTLARAVGLEGEALDVVTRAAELHDIGKVAMPEAILHKPGPLDVDEWELIREHPAIGERIVAAAPALRPVARLIRASHERWDGTGYPDGRAGEAIPLGARIVAVCDAYDAMISDRPYRRAMSHADAVAELEREAG